MNVSAKDWMRYVNTLSKLNTTAGNLMKEYIVEHGLDDMESVVDYAYALVTKYGEGSAALAAEMYDALAEAQGVIVPPAEVAPTATYGETAKAIYGTVKHSTNPNSSGGTVSRLVKQAGQDTTLKNALRDGAEFAWIPMGDTCVFCITLASRGWQKASKKAIKGGHAEHIHANCDCSYAIRFDGKSNVKGYDPSVYKKMYDSAEGKNSKEKLNSMRKKYRDENRDKINAQKRAAYAEKRVEQERNNRRNDLSINTDLIESKEYKEKFSAISSNDAVNSRLYNKSVEILKHRSGTDYEDMHLISFDDGKVKGSQTKVEYFDKVPEELRHNHVWYNESLETAVKNNPPKSLISIHNHSGNMPPSGGDFESQFVHNYRGGVISCHNGDLYYYEVGKKRFTGRLYDMTVDKYKKQGYSEKEAYIKTLEQFTSDYGIKWKRI